MFWLSWFNGCTKCSFAREDNDQRCSSGTKFVTSSPPSKTPRSSGMCAACGGAVGAITQCYQRGCGVVKLLLHQKHQKLNIKFVFALDCDSTFGFVLAKNHFHSLVLTAKQNYYRRNDAESLYFYRKNNLSPLLQLFLVNSFSCRILGQFKL